MTAYPSFRYSWATRSNSFSKFMSSLREFDSGGGVLDAHIEEFVAPGERIQQDFGRPAEFHRVVDAHLDRHPVPDLPVVGVNEAGQGVPDRLDHVIVVERRVVSLVEV